MQYKIINEIEFDYTGEQLRSHWIYEKFDLLGDAAVAFVGKSVVKLDHMVDIQDIKEVAPIYSSKMLNFIIEHYDTTIAEMVLRQRLFMAIIQDYINHNKGFCDIKRVGDDLFYEDGKLSVSIATMSPLSGLIHVGLNVLSEGAPVKAAGLTSELGLTNIYDIARDLLEAYQEEYISMKKATYKVKPVL